MMRLHRFLRTNPGRCFSFLLAEAFFLAPVACNSVNVGAGSGNPFAGLLINQESSGDVLGGIVLDKGSSVFAYGTKKIDGTIEELQALALRDANGNVASVIFESGRLAHAQGFDGSTIDVTYTTIEALRLAGTMRVFFKETDQTVDVPFDLDLRQTAEDIAALAKEYGYDVSTAAPPPGDGKAKLADLERTNGTADSFDVNGKDGNRAQAVVLLAVAYRLAFAVIGFALVRAIVQSVAAAVKALVNVVVESVIVAAFAPLVALAEICRGAIEQPVSILPFTLLAAVIIIPVRPRH